MINRSLLVGIVLFTIYSLVINLKPKLSSTQHQWQDNIAKAQNYVFNESDTLNNIIIGSSLSCRILTDSLPSFYNLSFNGQGIFDGLKIIKNKHNLPKNIFIETNVILRKENSDFTSSLLFPISFYLRKHLLSLRADKQPISILLRYLKIKNHQPNEIKNNIKLSTKSNEFYKNISKIKTTENLNFRNGNTFDNMFTRGRHYLQVLQTMKTKKRGKHYE